MGGYIGITDDYPVYETQIVTENITPENIQDNFTVQNASYYFVGNGDVFTSNNKGINNSTAETTLTALYDMSIEFMYSYSSEASYDKFTLIVGNTTVESGVSGSTTTKSYSGSLSAGDTITFRYVKDVSTHKYDDVCTFSYMTITTRKDILINTLRESRARSIKKGYVGVSNKARHITKGYVGVNGKARPCYVFGAGDTLVYYGTHDSGLSAGVSQLASATVGDYLLFAGGFTGTSYKSTVNSFNKSLTRGTATSLDNSTYALSGANFGNYALFAGGRGGSAKNTVQVYNSTLTKTSPCTLTNARWNLAGTALKDCAFFAGGEDGSYYYSDVDKINSSLTVIEATSELDKKSAQLAATSVGDYVIFAGGKFGSSSAANHRTVCAYNSSLTKTGLDGLSADVDNNAATTVGDKAIFTGGTSSIGKLAIVDKYDESLTHTTDELPSPKGVHKGTTLNMFGIFGGGEVTDNTVYSINESGTIEVCEPLSQGRHELAAGTIGNFALFAGGTDDSSYYTTVDVYTLL